MKKIRVVSGMRPTGALHLGHLLGAIDHWLHLQNDSSHECLFFVADFHALTSSFADSKDLPKHTLEMAADWLACGIDPNKSIIFVQSAIPQQPTLHLLLSMITPLGWLERNPTYKDMKQMHEDKDLAQLGFFSYPVMQTADIILFKGQKVPVGQDQVPHLELSREIVRRFNHIFGEIFPEPEALLTKTPKLLGTDGKKMSKSLGNVISLSDEWPDVEKKVRGMITDTQRVRRQDPGNPDNCHLFPLHQAFSPQIVQAEVRQECVRAGIGCVDCKKMLLPHLQSRLQPISDTRKQWLQKPRELDAILREGNIKACQMAEQTMAELVPKVHLPYLAFSQRSHTKG